MTPTSIKRPRLVTPPISTSWFDLPDQVRRMVIDKMDPKTRCRFAEGSKLCEKEAKASTNYLKRIEIKWFSNPKLYIGHDEKCYNYCLEFVEDWTYTTLEDKTTVIYKTFSKVDDINRKNKKKIIFYEKWRKIELGEAQEVRLRYLTEIVEKYGEGINRLKISDEDFSDKSILKKLKHLDYIGGSLLNVLKKDYLDLAQILNVERVDLSDTVLSFDQIVQLKGSKVTIKSVGFNEQRVLKYLKMWKNGEIDKNMENLKVIFCRSKHYIDGRRIMKALNGYDYVDNLYSCRFKFRLNYQRDENCYCLVNYSIHILSVKIEKETTFEEISDESTSEDESSSDEDSRNYEEEELTSDSDC